MPEGAVFDSVVISLRRTPERLRQFRENNPHLKTSVDTIEAVDGLELDQEELVRQGLLASDVTWVPGSLGAALSHRLCWLRAADTDRPLVIFEDDVLLRVDFSDALPRVLQALPADWDIVMLGYNTDSTLEMEIAPGCAAYGDFRGWYPTPPEARRFVNSPGSVSVVPLITAFGTCAYAVSPQGARKLLDKCFPLNWTFHYLKAFKFVLQGVTSDAVMCKYYAEMGAFVCIPPIALAPNDKTTSTVNA